MKYETFEAFKKAFDALSPEQREWVQDKARWERITPWAVMKEWTIPPTELLKGEE